MCLKAATSPKCGDYSANQFEADLKSFFEYCKENHLSDEDVKKLCEPLKKAITKPQLRKWHRILLVILVFTIILYLLSYFETVSWHYSAIGRIVLINSLSIYDWKHLKNQKCLIDKPKNSITPEYVECTYCEAVQAVQVEQTLDQEFVKERYIDANVPVILINALSNWPSFTNDEQYDFLSQILSDDDIYYSYPCKLSTNLYKHDAKPIGKVLEKLRKADSYFMHFENCEFEVMKAFRPFAPRPGFLHPEISPIQYSWLLTNKNYNVSKFKTVELNERITIIGQIAGKNRVRLMPVLDCEAECEVLEVLLNRGEVLLFTSLWDLEYKPEPNMENVAVILETH